MYASRWSTQARKSGSNEHAIHHPLITVPGKGSAKSVARDGFSTFSAELGRCDQGVHTDSPTTAYATLARENEKKILLPTTERLDLNDIENIRYLRILSLMKLVFFETPLFTRLLPDYLDDESYRALQRALLDYPELGDVMPGTGGFRKVRWEDTRRQKGKRGGLRVIYYYLTADHQIWFFTLYDKEEATDLTSSEKQTLKKAIQAELAARRQTR